ncbi:TIGR03086 family metal-binding protein [Fodinicola acaciae]|uniref:TIGR03086 family metal-binding protein n=1 Tax=Fodinicola acaciae TaxID=2681555 RepID=UPI0013D2F20F|nr:TIGR03086 family metal-binding protein [Fodinicola acaciae]
MPITSIDVVALDAQAVRTTIDLVSLAAADDWRKPTPCEGWTLYGLVAHMTAQHYGFAAASTGVGELSAWGWRPLGDDPVAAYRAAAEHVLAAFAEDGVLERIFPLPEFGAEVPGAQAAGFHLVDYVVHGWDVAKTLGVSVEFAPEVLDATLEIAKAVPDGEMRRAPGSSFGPVVAYSGGVKLDHIVALLGRSPSWR